MSTPKWEAGHLYLKGDLVQPVQAVGGVSVAITNAGFESGDTAWTKGTGWVVTNAVPAYAGSYTGEFQGAFAGPSVISMATAAACSPGQSITAKVKVNTGGNGVNDAGAAIRLTWLTAADAVIRVDEGNICRGGGNAWFESGVTATAPSTAAKVAVGCNAYRNDGSDALWIDNFTWNHVTPTAQEGLIYKAVQDDPGFSDSVEPAWPTTLGVQVIDNEVIWEAVLASRVTYEARPILKSGATEPAWPTTPGAFVVDGTISWECVSRRIEDENCPNTKVVHILAGKVFAVDGDIIRFCATANPLDWTTAEDAGYLPSGLQSANANDMAVLHQYRGNLAAFNASSFQNWQADPNPAAMAILDQIDGIGSTWPKAAQAVANDLLFLSQRGVRSVGIAAGAENLSAGDVGIPIDVLVQAALASAEVNNTRIISTHYPGAGQYWLAFSEYPLELVLTGAMDDAFVGDAASGAYTASGGVGPYTYTATPGTYPPGAILSAAGTWSGTHEGNGNGDSFWDFAPEITVTDVNGQATSITDSVRVTNFTISGDLVGGHVGETSAGSYTNNHGYGDITYSISAGAFPAGLTLAADGSWSGPFTTISAPSWTVTAVDEAGNIATLNDSANITDPPVLLFYNGSFKGARNALASNGVVGLPQIRVESEPQYATEGRLLVETNSSSWGVYDYNATTGQYVVLPISGTIHGDRATISPDGTYIVSVAASAGTFSYYVYAWDGVGYTLGSGPYNAAYATSGGPIKFSPDGTKLLHVVNLSQVYIHPFAAGVLTIGSGKALAGFNAAWSGDSRYVAVINTNFEPNDGTLTVFDSQGAMPTVGSAVAAGSGNRAAVAWGGSTAIYCSGDYNSNNTNFMHLSFSAGAGPTLVSRTLVSGSAGPSTLDVSNDGLFLAVQTYDTSQCVIYTLSGGVPTFSQTLTTANGSAWWVNDDI